MTGRTGQLAVPFKRIEEVDDTRRPINCTGEFLVKSLSLSFSAYVALSACRARTKHSGDRNLFLRRRLNRSRLLGNSCSARAFRLAARDLSSLYFTFVSDLGIISYAGNRIIFCSTFFYLILRSRIFFFFQQNTAFEIKINVTSDLRALDILFSLRYLFYLNSQFKCHYDVL